jgi:hypothetical protein
MGHMIWNRLKRFLTHGSKSDPEIPDFRWIEAVDNQWGIRLLDIRSFTLNTLSHSSDPQCAANAVSFGQENGTSFIGKSPPVSRTIQAALTFPVDRMLADGVLFKPCEMEHKWALFYHRGEIICVRSWLRQVHIVARLELHQDYAEVTQIHGTFGGEDEDADLTIQLFDYLLRSHALNMIYPVPLPSRMAGDSKIAAIWCMSLFGNRALFATPHRIDRHKPERPLRTHSLLHIAVARGHASEVDAHLAGGVPIDLLAGDGLAPLHWALAREDTAMMTLLLDRGSNVDVRSSEGATPLMNAVQSARLDKVRFLLDRGADVNARDLRGFTCLHRAAEMGHADTLQVLLDRGADWNLEAAGQTPRSLAEKRNNLEILAALNRYSSPAS